MRGSVPRAQIYMAASSNISVGRISILVFDLNIIGKNITVVRADIIMILAYSAIKIIANKPLLYSVLNPDTSSDSPSAKSNGVRFVSASVVINHIKNVIGTTSIISSLIFIILKKEYEENKISIPNKIKVILTS